jgi:hypothetical protein
MSGEEQRRAPDGEQTPRGLRSMETCARVLESPSSCATRRAWTRTHTASPTLEQIDALRQDLAHAHRDLTPATVTSEASIAATDVGTDPDLGNLLCVPRVARR